MIISKEKLLWVCVVSFAGTSLLLSICRLDRRLETITKVDGAAPQFPLPSNNSEWVQDLSEVIDCGKFKCAFRSQKYPETYGYVANKLNENEPLPKEIHASNLAHNLTERFGIRHFYLGSPRIIKCSKELAKRLNTIPSQYKRSPSAYFKAKHNILLQPIQLAPNGVYRLKVNPNKRKNERSNNEKKSRSILAEFAANKSRVLLGMELQKLEEQLLFDVDVLDEMLKQHGCLTTDFQILVDPWTGKIYHLDFDRCWELQGVNPALYDEGRKYIVRQVRKHANELLEIHRRNHSNYNTTY